MSAERYAQVRRLFLAACELAEGERGAFLDQACAGDPQLRAELESLLKQPRSTTIIGMSNDDVAHGKVLSPIAHLPRELIPANIPVEAARAEKPGRFSPARSLPPSATRFWGNWVEAARARYTGRTIRSWSKTWR